MLSFHHFRRNGFRAEALRDFLKIRAPKNHFWTGISLPHDLGPIRGSQNPGKAIARSGYGFWGEIAKHLLGRKGGENNQTTEGGKIHD
jgi:hypothetical protein